MSQQRAVAVTEMVYCGVVDRGEGEVWGKKEKEDLLQLPVHTCKLYFCPLL